jgi:DNA-binding GntR family transcriptional regulator
VSGRVIGLECHHIPADIGGRIDPEPAARRPVLELVEEAHGRRARRMRISIRAGTPTRAEGKKLGVSATMPVLIRRHTYVTDQGRPILCGRNLFTEWYEAILELEDREGQILANEWYPTVRH